MSQPRRLSIKEARAYREYGYREYGYRHYDQQPRRPYCRPESPGVPKYSLEHYRNAPYSSPHVQARISPEKFQSSKDPDSPSKLTKHQTNIAKDEKKGRMDGGLSAWLSVLSSFIIHFVVFAPQYSIGIYQVHLHKMYPLESKSSIALVGSLASGTLFLMAFLSGRLADAFGYQRMSLIGAMCVSAGLTVAGSASELWHLFLSQGVLFGLGCSLIFFPGLSLPSQWWDKRRAFATGIGVSGAGVGGLVMSKMAPILLDKYDFAWTMRIQGLMSFVLLVIACLTMRVQVPSTGKLARPIIDMKTLCNIRFIPLFIAFIVIPFGLQIPTYYLPQYASYVGISKDIVSILLIVLNAASIVGRIAGGYLGDKIGRLNSFIIVELLLGVSTCTLWLFSGASQEMLYAYIICFGFNVGAFMSLVAPVVGQLVGTQGLASKVGLLYTANALGNFVGPVLAGALVTEAPFIRNGNLRPKNISSGLFPSQAYGWAITFSAGMMMTPSVLLFVIRFGIVNRRFFVRV